MAKSIDEAQLKGERAQAAEHAFQHSDLPALEDFEQNWTVDGDVWSRKLYWEAAIGEESSHPGSFGVRFQPGSSLIIDQWNQ